FVMRYYARLTLDGVRLECVAAASPGDRHEPAPVDGWRRVYAPNRPLSHKGNHAARTLEGRVDAVLNVGSDDVCSPGYIAAAVNAIRGGADYVVPEGLCLWDLATDRCMEVDAPRIGAGRVLSARLLDTLRWHPWPVRGNVPDADMDERLRQHAPEALANPARVTGNDVAGGMVVCDIKCGDNIGTFDAVVRRRGPQGQTRDVPRDALLSALHISTEDADALKGAHLRFRYTNALDPMNPERLHPSEERPVRVRAVKPFTNRQEEREVRRGAAFYATERRAAELHRAGMVAVLDAPEGFDPEAGAARRRTADVVSFASVQRRPRRNVIGNTGPAVKEEKAPEKATKEEKAPPKRTTKDAAPAAPAGVEVAEDVSVYHVGGGYYQL